VCGAREPDHFDSAVARCWPRRPTPAMPLYVPVVDTERPRSERDDESDEMKRHRAFDNPHQLHTGPSARGDKGEQLTRGFLPITSSTMQESERLSEFVFFRADCYLHTNHAGVASARWPDMTRCMRVGVGGLGCGSGVHMLPCTCVHCTSSSRCP
jgi:hypothetical protein